MNRRGFLGALGAVIAAPAVVRYASLMPPRVVSSPLQELADYARRMGIEPGPDGNYVAIMHPNTARTLFGELTPAQKKMWAQDVWKQANESMFLARFMGETGPIQGVRIITVPSSIHPQDGRITVAPPNPVLALRQQLRMRAG